MFRLILVLLFSSLLVSLQGQESTIKEGDIIDFKDITSLSSFNTKTMKSSTLSKGLNILVFGSFLSAEGMILSNELNLVVDSLPNCNVVLIANDFQAQHSLAYAKLLCNKYDVKFPILNDVDSGLTKKYGIERFPTALIVYPNGTYVGQALMDDFEHHFLPFYDDLKQGFEGQFEEVSHKISAFKDERITYSFITYTDSKEFILVNEESSKIELRDQNFNRLYEYGIPENSFVGGIQYDTESSSLYYTHPFKHKVFQLILRKDFTKRLIGNGSREEIRVIKKNYNDPLAYPTGISVEGNDLYVSSSASHQVLNYDMRTGIGYNFAGDGLTSPFFRDGYRYEAGCLYPTSLLNFRNNLIIVDEGYHLIREVKTGRLTTRSYNWDFDKLHIAQTEVFNDYLVILNTLYKTLIYIDMNSLQYSHTLSLSSYLEKNEFPLSLTNANNRMILTLSNSNKLLEVKGITDAAVEKIELKP